MGRFFVEKVIVPALQALREPKEQVYLGLTLATVLVLLFGPGGVTTGSQATNGQVTTREPRLPMFLAKPRGRPQLFSRDQNLLSPLNHGQSTCRKLNQKRQSQTTLPEPNQQPQLLNPDQSTFSPSSHRLNSNCRKNPNQPCQDDFGTIP